ncbi:unnamed protein product [Discula destructiva]
MTKRSQRQISHDEDPSIESRPSKKSRPNTPCVVGAWSPSAPSSARAANSNPPLPAASRPKRRAETAPEALEHGKHTSKRARVDYDLVRATRSPSPWLSLPVQPEQSVIPLDNIQRAHVRRQIRQALERSLDLARKQQDEHIKFRKGHDRLPSPASSDDGSRTAFIDPEADKFGFTPCMLALQADDPRVDEVFGTEYAGRLRELQYNTALTHTHQARRSRKSSVRRKTTRQDSSPSQRRTRQSQTDEGFFELDRCGRPRLLQ